MQHVLQLKSYGAWIKGWPTLKRPAKIRFSLHFPILKAQAGARQRARPWPIRSGFSGVVLGLCLAACGANDARTSVPAQVEQPQAQAGYSDTSEQTQNKGGAQLTAEKTQGPDGTPSTKKTITSEGAFTDLHIPHDARSAAQRFAQLEAARAAPCADLICYRFNAAALALSAVVRSYAPLVMSFGEAHASREFSGKSTVARFTSELLPVVAPQSSYLFVELLAPPKEGCELEKAAAQIESDKITETQSQNNQGEYVALGLAAQKQRVIPDILRATCPNLKHIASPEGGVLAYMELIAQLFERDVSALVGRTKPGRPTLLTYGGALHNDAAPRTERESWSFGPALLDKTHGRYLEVDLIVPELISDSETWRTFAWFDAYQDYQIAHSKERGLAALVIPWGEHSVALIFPQAPD